MNVDGKGKKWRWAIIWVSCLLLTLAACNVEDSAVMLAGGDTGGGEEDIGEGDSGLPDADKPDAEDPEAEQPDSEVAPGCDDGVQNGDESDVDCGGTECGACEPGESCVFSDDCATGYCTGGVCVDESCENVSCGDEEACYRGVCYLSCEESDACDPSSRCYQGACIPTDCSEVVCRAGEACYRGVCYEASACSDASDCEPSEAGPWGECVFGDNVCALTGVESRTVTTFSCGESSTCEMSEVIEERDCRRELSVDQQCGEPIDSGWSECVYASPCDTTGERVREIITFVCSEGSCEHVEERLVDTRGCERDTTGATCNAVDVTEWGPCMADVPGEVCNTAGTRKRERTEFRCADGGCSASTVTESEACVLRTAGRVCGIGMRRITDCTATGGTINSCTDAGQQTTTITTPVCGTTGACDETETTTEDSACQIYVEEGTYCSMVIPVDSRECVMGRWRVSTWDPKCDGQGTCEAIRSTYDDGPCMEERCPMGNPCETSSGQAGCCSSENVCVSNSDPNPVPCLM
ncbi:hypothetical protein DL240_17225 [Lujinxingia litoralis]|uniref:SRCR domain-containing protein n=1 Tax=Lujinxingia litoralis TaxID=2211119 RepID=A0A328C1M6_9DELT|nr:hypothetical protein [Lujinxingia litoralis]RAL20323.1 hypothetical protein DL240_17225 [Lujinxingia litoralis]